MNIVSEARVKSLIEDISPKKAEEDEVDEFTRLVQLFCKHYYVVNGRCVTCHKVIGK